ncbi:predicted protein [Uncinocarpus reesii 1704]|uniref:SH3 domain-containing protein n=1 Tax=Uncinocarpus reesii (strain UAMH 1704) TaxID=336963 RepID=C4JYH3_UNCRE|nr:uncharacterized protein UREG_07224 [Uncinocarpus reesii 1704]EEP82359.1 predicted protein [Uncinocarpus reesii 1704]
MHNHHRHHARQHAQVEARGPQLFRDIEIIGGNIKPIANKDDDDVEIIYITAKPTFDGPIGGYSTEGRGPPRTTIDIGPPVKHTRPPRPDTDDPTPTRTPVQRPTRTSSPVATTEESSSRPKAPSTSFATSTPTSARELVPSTTSDNGIGLASITSSPSATNTAVASPGLSDGAKAGLAIGIIALVGLIAGVALLFIRKKKKTEEAEEIQHEKPFPPIPSPQQSYSPPPPQQVTSSAPPQLNVRPMTQFSPDFTGHGPNNMAMVNVAGVAGVRNLTGQHNDSQSTFAPPRTADSTSNPFNDPVNPFETRSGASSPTSPPGPAPQPLNVRTPSPGASSMRMPSPEGMTTGVAATGTAITAGSVAVAAITPATANSHSGKPPTLQHVPGPPAGWMKDMPPPSPAKSFESVSVTSTTAAAVATGGPALTNVHRVQLDFAPSMDDELELRAGQLVRLLHEYDDGWALCIRLDRSQQGVAPRSCLSARPVKPRQRSPPGSGPRGPPPIGGVNGRPMSPAGGRNSPVPGPPPSGPPPQGPPRFAPQQNSRPASPSSGYRPYIAPGGPPVRFPDVPRSLSPGPGSRLPPQSNRHPGPPGVNGLEKPNMPANQRQRSNSAASGRGRVPAPIQGPSSLGASVQNVNSTDSPVEKPSTAPSDQPVEQPVNGLMENPVEQPVEKPVEQPTNNPGEQPADQPAEQPQIPAEQPPQSTPVSLPPVERKPLPGQAQ